MQTMTSDELCSMEIINLCGGTCLGTPESLELRCGCDGCVITALIVPCETGGVCLVAIRKAYSLANPVGAR